MRTYQREALIRWWRLVWYKCPCCGAYYLINVHDVASRGRRLFETSLLLEEMLQVYNHIHNTTVFLKQMVWQTCFIFTLFIKHVQKEFIFASRDQCACTNTLQNTKHTSRLLQKTKASAQRCFIKKVFLKWHSGVGVLQ